MPFGRTSGAGKAYFDQSMPEPVIPTRHTPWFLKALWLLAVLMVVGIVYSFWRIANVASPTLDVPAQTPGQAPAQAAPAPPTGPAQPSR